MVDYVAMVKERLLKLSFPAREDDITKLYLSLLNSLPWEVVESGAAELTSCLEKVKDINYCHIADALARESDNLIIPLYRELPTPLQFLHLKYLFSRLYSELLRRAARFVRLPDLSDSDAFERLTTKLNVGSIALAELRVVLSRLIPSDESFKHFITNDIVSAIYESCRHEFSEKTQTQIIDMRGNTTLRLYIEDYFEGLIDLAAFERQKKPLLEIMLTRRLCKEHMKHMQQELERTFLRELSCCAKGAPADHDIDPSSDKGAHLYYIVTLAKKHQPNEQFATECLQRVITAERYTTTEISSLQPQLLLEVISRLYIGILGLQNVCSTHNRINAHPDVYRWMHAVLAELYKYSSRTTYHENRFLSTMNRCATVPLKQHGGFHQNLRYVLELNQRQPNSYLTCDFQALVDEKVVFRYMSDSSIASMMYISGMRDVDNLQEDAVAPGLDFSVDVLCWKCTGSKPVKRQIRAEALIAFPAALISSWIMAGPIFVHALADMLMGKREKMQRNLKKAKKVGVYLGLLFIHGKIVNRVQSLFGFCMGAQIVLSCLAEIAEYNRKVTEDKRVYLLDVVLFLGPVEAREFDWNLVVEPVRGRFINICSSRDVTFKRCIAKTDIQAPIGCAGLQKDGIENYDMSDVLPKDGIHTNPATGEVVNPLKKILKLINYYP